MNARMERRGATMLQQSQVSLIYGSVSCVGNIRWDRTWERACSKHGMEEKRTKAFSWKTWQQETILQT